MVRMTAADKKLLKQITSVPWPPDTSSPLEGSVEAAEDEQLELVAQSYASLEVHLTAAAELNRRHGAEQARNLALAYPSLSEAQLRSKAMDTALEDPGLEVTGIARRFLVDDPSELARFAAVSVRREWINRGHGAEDYVGIWNTVLWALAIGDDLAVERFLASLPPMSDDELETASPPYYAEFYDAIFGLLRADPETARGAVEQLQSHRLPADEVGVAIALRGITDRSAELVADGMKTRAQAVRRIRAIDPHHKLLDVLLHGLHQLCERIDPALARLWDAGHGLPWDSEFHDWRRLGSDPLGDVDLGGLPERFRILLTELPEPDWWSGVRA